MGVSAGPDIIEDGLVLALDAADKNSYPGSGTTWYDLSENNNSGSLVNGPTFNTGSLGSIVFDGVDDYVDLNTYAENIIVNSPASLNVWVKPSYNKNTKGGSIFHMGNGVDIGSGGDSFIFNYGSTTGALNGETFTVLNYVNGDGSNELTLYGIQNGEDFQNQWVNACLIIENNQWKIYINSQEKTLTKGSSWQGQLFSFGDNISPKSVVTIGANRARTFGGPFEGSIVGLQIYNRALTSEEVLQNYNATKARFGL